MGTTTHKIVAEPGRYANVSNGNLNCTVFVSSGGKARVVIDGSEPAADAEAFMVLYGPVTFQATDLEMESDVWIMPHEDKPVTLVAFRGESKFAVVGQDREF